MNYEWDPNKAKSNYKKHGVRFADAVGVFEVKTPSPFKMSMNAKIVTLRLAGIS